MLGMQDAGGRMQGLTKLLIKKIKIFINVK